MKEIIENKLKTIFQPNYLKVINNSHLHKGHHGDNGTGETHFKIEISAKELTNKNKIAAHRQINNILREEFAKGLHALEIKIIYYR